MTDPVIDISLVQQLIATQFPEWTGLALEPVPQGGWDNRSFRLGQTMLVRLPSAAGYAPAVEREQRWLPLLAPRLSQPIPVPLAAGRPGSGYPWRWSVYRWLDGETALPERIGDLQQFAQDLALFLRSLHGVCAEGGPVAGKDNYYRGAPLAVYDAEARAAIATLASRLDAAALTAVWDAALASTWTQAPLWVHGDISVGNLLVREGRLCGVIDFGQLCVGDPACDLVPAWTLFDLTSRALFRATMALDDATWARGRGWVLWKALITAAQASQTNAWEGARCWNTIKVVLADRL